MKECTVCGIQITVTPGDSRANMEKAAIWLRRAKKLHDCDLAVLPESYLTGFAPPVPLSEFHATLPQIPGPETDFFSALCRELNLILILPMYEQGPDQIIYNSSLLIDETGALLGNYRKTHPFPTERAWTTAGTDPVVCDTRIGKIGMIICYDGDFPELVRAEALAGAEIIVRPSAFMRSFEIWDLTNRARAYDNHVYVIAVNSVGPDAENLYFGSSMIVSPIAQKLAQARGGEEIIAARLDPDPIKCLTYGSLDPMRFDHIEDRNLTAYRDILKPGRCPFEPAERIGIKK